LGRSLCVYRKGFGKLALPQLAIRKSKLVFEELRATNEDAKKKAKTLRQFSNLSLGKGGKQKELFKRGIGNPNPLNNTKAWTRSKKNLRDRET
jgi:hypothetical protein